MLPWKFSNITCSVAWESMILINQPIGYMKTHLTEWQCCCYTFYTFRHTLCSVWAMTLLQNKTNNSDCRHLHSTGIWKNKFVFHIVHPQWKYLKNIYHCFLCSNTPLKTTIRMHRADCKVWHVFVKEFQNIWIAHVLYKIQKLCKLNV